MWQLIRCLMQVNTPLKIFSKVSCKKEKAIVIQLSAIGHNVPCRSSSPCFFSQALQQRPYPIPAHTGAGVFKVRERKVTDKVNSENQPPISLSLGCMPVL